MRNVKKKKYCQLKKSSKTIQKIRFKHVSIPPFSSFLFLILVFFQSEIVKSKSKLRSSAITLQKV